jgi:hypothetical protein
MSSRYAKEFAQCILENQGAVFSEESTDKSVINSAFNNLSTPCEVQSSA